MKKALLTITVAMFASIAPAQEWRDGFYYNGTSLDCSKLKQGDLIQLRSGEKEEFICAYNGGYFLHKADAKNEERFTYEFVAVYYVQSATLVPKPPQFLLNTNWVSVGTNRAGDILQVANVISNSLALDCYGNTVIEKSESVFFANPESRVDLHAESAMEAYERYIEDVIHGKQNSKQ